MKCIEVLGDDYVYNSERNVRHIFNRHLDDGGMNIIPPVLLMRERRRSKVSHRLSVGLTRIISTLIKPSVTSLSLETAACYSWRQVTGEQ